MKGFMFGCGLGIGVVGLSVILTLFVTAYPTAGLVTLLGAVVLFFGYLFRDFT